MTEKRSRAVLKDEGRGNARHDAVGSEGMATGGGSQRLFSVMALKLRLWPHSVVELERCVDRLGRV